MNINDLNVNQLINRIYYDNVWTTAMQINEQQQQKKNLNKILIHEVC